MASDASAKVNAILMEFERLKRSQASMRRFMEQGLAVSGKSPFNVPFFENTLISFDDKGPDSLMVMEPLVLLYVQGESDEYVELRNVPQGDDMRVVMTTSYVFVAKLDNDTGNPVDAGGLLSSQRAPDMAYSVPGPDEGILGVRIFTTPSILDACAIPLGVNQSVAVSSYPAAVSRAPSGVSLEKVIDFAKVNSEKASLLTLVGRILKGETAPLRGQDLEEEGTGNRDTNAQSFFAADDFEKELGLGKI